jgi:hypothetical protein
VARKQYLIRAFNVESAKPFWKFSPTAVTPISGSYRFHMIVRSAASSTTRGTVELTAIMRGKKFLFLPYESTLSSRDRPEEFRLEPH